MKTTNQLFISVQDHTYNYCSANVKIRQIGKGKWQSLTHDKSNDCYYWKNFQPGQYELQVNGKKGWINDHRIITLKNGTNNFHSSIAPANTPYYLAADDEKVFFETDESKILLYVTGRDAERCTEEVCKKNKIKATRVKEAPDTLSAGHQNKYLLSLPKGEKKAKEYLDRLSEVVENDFREVGVTAYIALPMIKGEEVVEGLTNELIIKFESHVTQEEVRRIAKEYGFEVTRTVDYLGNTYVFRYGKYPDYAMLKLTVAQRERLPIVWVEPNRIEQRVSDSFSPNDYLYPELPHLTLINADEAWDTLDDINVNLRAGSPDITIAVFDVNGVSPSHPDLTGNLTDGTAKMIANFDFANWQVQTVANLGGDHGTECASSATGRFNNNTGATGVAGNCHLIGGSLGVTLLDQADAWIWSAGFTTGNTNAAFPAQLTQGADVITNSWGANGAALSNTYRDAFDFLTTYGRNGRGCIVCFSIGNNGYLDFTTHATRRRMYAAYEKTIAIGASINSNPTNPVSSFHAAPGGGTNNLPAVVDTRSYYSPYGPALDIVAPSHTCWTAPPGPTPVDQILSAVIENTGDVPGAATTATTLQSNAAAGANSISIVSAAGFAVGNPIIIGVPGGGNREFKTITGIAGNTISLNTNLVNAQAAGTNVSTGPDDYSIDFGGTSHACPTVAGAAALVLSARPILNWVQVREILRTTAVRIDFGQTNAIGQWVDNDGDTIDEFSQWYGYGRLDVDAAVNGAINTTDLSDVVIRDNLADTGAVPSGGWHAHSPDIWVRTTNDPIPALAYGANPPHENAVRGQDNYVFLRVRNFGTAASNEVYLRALICHFPGFEFRYPTEWQPTNRPGQAVPSPLTPGTYVIGEQRIDNLGVGANQIVKITWDSNLVPPETVIVAAIPVNWHPCILAEVSPHDGPDPATSGHAVKDNNNLAHRNIRIDDDPDGDSSLDDFAVGVVAGTSDKFAVKSVILDRSYLPDSYDIFIRTENEKVMDDWKRAIKSGQVFTTEVLPGSTSREEGERPANLKDDKCGITLIDPARLAIKCCDGNYIVIHAPAKTKIETNCKPDEVQKPRLTVGKYQGQEVIIYKGGSDAIELPFNLPSNEFTPLVIGMKRPSGMRKQGYLKATQRKWNGELSPGYTIEG